MRRRALEKEERKEGRKEEHKKDVLKKTGRDPSQNDLIAVTEGVGGRRAERF